MGAQWTGARNVNLQQVRSEMKLHRILLVGAVWAGMSLAAGMLVGSQASAADPGSLSPALGLASEIAMTQQPAVGRPRARNGSPEGGPAHVADARSAVSRQAVDVLPAVAQRSAAAGVAPDAGTAPEPAGWMLLLSGLAIVICIAWRRTSVALM